MPQIIKAATFNEKGEEYAERILDDLANGRISPYWRRSSQIQKLSSGIIGDHVNLKTLEEFK